jgi:hypothetical protein
MTTKLLVLTAMAASLASATDRASEADLERDRKAILAMAGTYTVTFDFAETVAIEPGYEMHEPYHATALAELVEVVVDEPKRIVLQHLLVTEDGVTKHWRQDWTYEDPDLHEFVGHHTWRHRRLDPGEVEGAWTQTVYQVDDSPRYAGHGRWTHADGLAAWESGWAWRPLPRREFTKRDDYDVLIARNRHTLTHTGWVHEQDNYKLVLRDGVRKVLARETGLNRYDHVDPSKADAARGYWSRTSAFWSMVREAWDEILVPGATVELEPTVDGKPLYRPMFELADAWDGNDAARAAREVRALLDRYREPAAVAAATRGDEGQPLATRSTLGSTP